MANVKTLQIGGVSYNLDAYNADYAGAASYLAIHNPTSTQSYSASSWDGAVSEGTTVWREAFKDTSITSDTGDLVLKLRSGIYSSNSTELCMCIDGDYYAMGNKVLNAANYTNWVPTKTGSGASGTWGINISGTASNADTLDGNHASAFATSSHSHGGMWNYGNTSWSVSNNVTCTGDGEWSIDVTDTGSGGAYWHVWSGNQNSSMLSCYPYSGKVYISNGGVYAGLHTYGLISQTTSTGTLTMGSQNNAYCHMEANHPFYFNKNIFVDGNICKYGSSKSVGTSDNYWDTAYISTVYGNLSGHASTAGYVSGTTFIV